MRSGDPNVAGVQSNESDLVRWPDDSMLCVLRTGGGEPLYAAKSDDGGQTWRKPWPLEACGVRPRLRLLTNGVVTCSCGRVTHPPSLGKAMSRALRFVAFFAGMFLFSRFKPHPRAKSQPAPGIVRQLLNDYVVFCHCE